MRTIRALLLVPALALSAPPADAADAEQFDWHDVSRIFAVRCLNCHAAHGAAKGLRLDSYDAAIAGSKDGPVLVAGDPDASELVRRIRGQSTPRMPFLSRPLPQDEIDLIVRWVEGGLQDARR